MDRAQESGGGEERSHIPVMLNEVIEHLKPAPGNIFVDGTLGLGGHAKAVLGLIGEKGRLVGIDRDARALAVAKMNLEAYVTRCDFVYDNYCHIDEILARHGIRAADRILFDLGLSSFQLNDPSRGFSFRAEGPLDMRMDQESYISAFDLVNSLSQEEISLILKDFGEERWHRRIARSIVERRSHKPIETTKELSDIVLRAMPHHAGREKIHPATRTFQALRIAVNRELEALEEALGKCGAVLADGGRIGVISFHSLEDRIVKQKFRDWARAGKFRLITKKPLRPSECEAKSNPRARSARLRIAERI